MDILHISNSSRNWSCWLAWSHPCHWHVYFFSNLTNFTNQKQSSIILPLTSFLLSIVHFLSNFCCQDYTKDKGELQSRQKEQPTPTKQFNLELFRIHFCIFVLLNSFWEKYYQSLFVRYCSFEIQNSQSFTLFQWPSCLGIIQIFQKFTCQIFCGLCHWAFDMMQERHRAQLWIFNVAMEKFPEQTDAAKSIFDGKKIFLFAKITPIRNDSVKMWKWHMVKYGKRECTNQNEHFHRLDSFFFIKIFVVGVTKYSWVDNSTAAITSDHPLIITIWASFASF